MRDKIKKSVVLVLALISFVSLYGQTKTYGDTLFFENFRQHTERVKSQHMPSGSYTFADPNGNSDQKVINDGYYAVVDPRHIADAHPDYYFWTSSNPNSLSPNGAKPYTVDHTGNKDGAVMVVNAGKIKNYIYQRDSLFKTGYRYLFSFYIYVVNPTCQFSIEAKNATNGKTYSYSGIVLSEEGKWIKYDLNFPVPISGTDTTNVVTVGLLNESTVVSGNDYYIDDILVSRLYTDPLTLEKTSKDISVCQGSSTYLTVKPLSEVIPFEFLWTGPNGFTSTDQSPFLQNITTEMDGWYRVKVTDALGQTATDSTLVRVNKGPNCDFTFSSGTVNIKHNSVTCSIPPEKGVTYEWDFGDGTTRDTQASVMHDFTITGSTTEFVVKLTATDSIGCTNTVSRSIEIMPFISTVFSPNGDGVNDKFMEGFDVQIFDRNGMLLYKGKDGWNGTYNGKTVDPDTYFYLVNYLDKNKKVQTKKGYITLVR